MANIEISAREEFPTWLTYGTPVFTIITALAASSIALIAIDVSPITAYIELFVGTLTSVDSLINVLIRTVPLALTGLAVYIPRRANLWNIGAEGQLYVGAIIGTWTAVNVELPIPGLVILVLLAGGIGGGLFGAVVGFLKARWDVNEIIVTLMFTYAAIRITDYLVQGPMQGASGALSGTAMIPPAGQVPTLPGTRLHFGVVLTVLLIIATWFFISRTIHGYKISMTGSNEHATESAGIDKGRLYILVFVLGGALAGLAGIIEIAGVQGRLRSTFSPGYGFTAIPIALLGRNGAFQVLLAAAFFALLFIGGQNIVVSQGVPSSLIEIIQAFVILFLITAEFFKSYKLDIELGSRMTSSLEALSTGDN